MIDIKRCPEPPPSLATKKSWRGQDVLEQLALDFLGKCYLCETPVPHTTMEVDHRQPRALFPERSFDWSNLFPTCPHCNGRRPAWPDTGLLDPGAEHRLEERLQQNWREDKPLFAAMDLDDLPAVNTAKELHHLHNHDDGAAKARALRDAILVQVTRVQNALTRYLLARHDSDPAALACSREELRRLVSREAPYTMLIRSALPRHPLVDELLD